MMKCHDRRVRRLSSHEGALPLRVVARQQIPCTRPPASCCSRCICWIAGGVADRSGRPAVPPAHRSMPARAILLAGLARVGQRHRGPGLGQPGGVAPGRGEARLAGLICAAEGPPEPRGREGRRVSSANVPRSRPPCLSRCRGGSAGPAAARGCSWPRAIPTGWEGVADLLRAASLLAVRPRDGQRGAPRAAARGRGHRGLASSGDAARADRGRPGGDGGRRPATIAGLGTSRPWPRHATGFVPVGNRGLRPGDAPARYSRRPCRRSSAFALAPPRRGGAPAGAL